MFASRFFPARRAGVFAILLALGHSVGAFRALSASPPAGRAPSGVATLATDIAGTVTDSASGRPLPGGEVRILQGDNVVAVTNTDEFGRFVVHNLPIGTYSVSVRYLGYQSQARSVNVANAGAANVAIRLISAAVSVEAIAVTETVPLAVDTRTGDQVFKQNDYHGAPTNTTSQILQQSIAGSVRAPTGEVHIRGQHAEYTYYVDGVPVPAGISGSLNELFDPAVVNQIHFQTGGWDAEYGNKNTAVVNVTTRIPSGGFHLDASAYGGSFVTSGQSLALSGNAGQLGLFFSGARQVTDMRREPVVGDTLTSAPFNFHNHGEDLFAFAKVSYVPTDRDVINLDLNRSRTRFQVPFDSTAGVIDDNQQDVNGFVNLGWRHRFGDSDAGGPGGEFFAAAFYRDGTLKYTPGLTDAPSFVFFPDTLTPYNLTEDRNFQTTGVKLDYTIRPQHGLEFKLGTLASITRGHELFATVDSAGNPGPTSDSDLKGSDVGVYAQTAYSPSDQFEIRAGARFDNHNAPFAGDQHQVSPRLKLSFFADPENTLFVYYARLFLPTNVEDLRAITSTAQGGVATDPTLPERDNFFEVGYIHRFPYGVVTKLAGYYKQSNPGIDDNTVPGSAITTSVNIDSVWIAGLEAVLEVRPPGPLSGYVNLSVNHAYGVGPITGGFFPADTPNGYFDLDHDQRVSGVANLLYSESGFFVSATGIYGSGLTNGNDPDASYGTGLFDFNKSIKVDPSFIMNASAGYAFAVGDAIVRPQLYVENVLDQKYLLKGAFFSGASFGRPRSVQFRVNIGM